jgi:hypothetical protein
MIRQALFLPGELLDQSRLRALPAPAVDGQEDRAHGRTEQHHVDEEADNRDLAQQD